MEVRGSAPRPGRLYLWEDTVPFVEEAACGPGAVWKDGKSRPHRDSIPERPACRSVGIATELQL